MPMLPSLKVKFALAQARLHNRIAAFWVVFSGVWMMLPAFQGVMTPKMYFGFSGLVVIAYIWARVTKQEGIVDD